MQSHMKTPTPYEPPQSNVGGPTEPQSKIMAAVRGLAAAIIGLQIGAFIGIALSFEGLLEVGAALVAMILCIAKGRNRLLYLLVLLVLTYIASSAYSRHKVSAFCDSITAATKPADLPRLAEQAQVRFRSFPVPDPPGEFLGLALESFSDGGICVQGQVRQRPCHLDQGGKPLNVKTRSMRSGIGRE